MADHEVAVPGGGVLTVAEDELHPGLQTTMPPVRTAEEQRWYLKGKTTDWDLGAELVAMALLAARYHGKNQYQDRLPRLEGGKFDHKRIAGNVMRWVGETLEPDTGFRQGELTLKAVVELFSKNKLIAGKKPTTAIKFEERPISFVCIDHAQLAAALFRRLRYKAQEVNIVAGLNTTFRKPDGSETERRFWTYQSAAVRVWFNGTWNYLDPFLETTDLNYTIRATVTSPRTLLSGLTGIKSHEQARQLPWSVYVAKGPIESFRLSGSFRRGMSLQGRWRSIRNGWYDVKKNRLMGFRTEVFIPKTADSGG